MDDDEKNTEKGGALESCGTCLHTCKPSGHEHQMSHRKECKFIDEVSDRSLITEQWTGPQIETREIGRLYYTEEEIDSFQREMEEEAMDDAFEAFARGDISHSDLQAVRKACLRETNDASCDNARADTSDPPDT